MTATTTVLAIPYPTDVDNPGSLAVHTAIQNAATTFDAFFGAWTGWTPTLGQGVTTNITKTVDVARFRNQGKLTEFEMRLLVTGTGTASAKVSFTLPSAARKSGIIAVGFGGVADTSATQEYHRAAILDTGSTTSVVFQSTSGLIGASAFTAALANTDIVWCTGFYERA